MVSLLLSISVSAALWWWYFAVKNCFLKLGPNYRRILRRQLLLTWIVTVFTVFHIVYKLLDPDHFGEYQWF